MVQKKKKIDLTGIALLVFITTILATFISLSRYKSTLATGGNAQVGKPIVNLESSTTITLEEMKPGDTKEYDFSVKNQENEVTTDTAMGYIIKIETGSYLPLIMELYSITNGIVGTENLLNNSNTTSERELNLFAEEHSYKLVVKWFETENNYKYSEEIDYIKIKLNGYQKST